MTTGDATPDVTTLYIHRGFAVTNLWGTNTLNRVYHDSGALLSETVNGLTVSNRHDALLRRTNVALLNDSASQLTAAGYSFDAAGRLDTVTDGTNSATYSYLANSPLVQQIVFRRSGQTRMTTTKSYDFLNRLTQISSVDSQQVAVASFAYAHNAASQRTSLTNADGSFWVYLYDALGQVTSARKYWPDGTPVLGQQFDYTFDDIGNRKSAVTGGDQWGANKRYQNYTANLLNQYTSRTVPGYVDIVGTATNAATVTLWSADSLSASTPTTRKGEYFRGEIPFNNSTGAVWLTVTNLAVLPNGTNVDILTNLTGSLAIPQTPEGFAHDLDGNLTRDGLWTNVWDGENRLVAQETVTAAYEAGVPRQRLEYDYDPQGRRLSKRLKEWLSGDWSLRYEVRFAWDGWNLLAEVNPTNQLSIRSYAWGLDLSGSEQGAGGVGGLLKISNLQSPISDHFVAYDGNGNVAALLNATDGTVSANYEYGPFGEVIRATGAFALANPFRFSTRYQDDESRALYYGYRTYNPTTGRWPNRDPLGEAGGLNLYVFVANDPLTTIDALGLKQYKIWASAFIMPATITFPHTFKTAPFIDLFATWAGNGRGFGPGPLAPWYSKMAHEVVIETDPTKPAVVSNGSVGGSSAVWYMTAAGPAFATGVSPAPAVATVTRPSRCITKVVINGSVTNPLEPLAPSIDYSYTFVFDSLKGRVDYSGRHDHYPWHELYVNGVSLVTDAPLGPTYTPADLIFSHTISPGWFGIPKECCKTP